MMSSSIGACIAEKENIQQYNEENSLLKQKQHDILNASFDTLLNEPLRVVDPEIAALIKLEAKRQFQGLELIASENYTSVAVLQANGSVLTNKYAEGLPGARYYGGNDVIDQIEQLCQQRALSLFSLNTQEWGVNVQSYSGSTANLAVYVGLLQPHDRIMGLDLPSGGHLTHGYATAKRKVSSTSIFYESLPYQVDPMTGLIDYDRLQINAKLFHPKLIICGGSAYPREWDYARLRQIAESEGASLMCDMAHISGLVAAQVVQNPFLYADVVTTTTHKTLRGPRAGLIFYRKNLEQRINNAVFPGCQGGPHENCIAAVAVALKQASTPAFQAYAQQVLKNCQALAAALIRKGFTLSTNGTDNHLLLWDLRPLKLSGSKLERMCELVHITVNKNSVSGDVSAINPGGVRLGTAALTTRGMREEHFEYIADLLEECVQICQRYQSTTTTSLKDFVSIINQDPQIYELATKVQGFSEQFKMPVYEYTLDNY